ncbi:retrovirus-related pol polyprotein from transposon TNT 1-94 [Tanacetum coccineum]
MNNSDFWTSIVVTRLEDCLPWDCYESWQFRNQRTMEVAGDRETIGSPVVQQNGIHCFNCKGFGHYAKEYRKPKRFKDYTYHKEKMMIVESYLHAAVESLQAVETLQWENILTVGSSSNSGNHSTNSGNPLAFYSQQIFYYCELVMLTRTHA